MAERIPKRTARQIVEAVQDVCGYDINFINPDGRIFESTNPARVGSFHEAGREAAKTGKTIEVTASDAYFGAQPGVNIPLSHAGEVVAVIGITGDPDTVRRFGVLAQKITALILRENELERQTGSERAQMDHIVRALALGEHINYDYYCEFMTAHGVALSGEHTAVLLRTHAHEENLTALKSDVTQTLLRERVTLFAFVYPHEFILLPETVQLPGLLRALETVSDAHPGALRIAVGTPERLSRQSRSYEAARIALRAMQPGQALARFEELDLEILLGAVPEEAKARFLERTAGRLQEKDRAILRAYFGAGMRLKQASEALYLHKNTLQYQLDRIHRETGYNPREFADAVILYLALKL